MKMTSSTSITSTSGVTLICETICPRPCPESIAIGVCRLLGKEMTLGDIQKFGSEIVHLGREHSYPRGEIVVEHLRGYRGHQPDRGGDQGLGDSRRDRLDTRRMRRGQPEERRHDSPHCAEQSDKRGRRSAGREECDARLELRELDVFLALH